jgi:hypothetical protein
MTGWICLLGICFTFSSINIKIAAGPSYIALARTALKAPSTAPIHRDVTGVAEMFVASLASNG